jgi:hypothetical protein
MKKFSKILFVMMILVISTVLFISCTKEQPQVEEKEPWEFEVGTDAVTYTTPGSNQYAGTFKINLKIVGGEGENLFNGVVTLTTNTQWCSEAIQAAVSDKGLAQSGIEVGFITKIGDYENNSQSNLYWLYTVNGVTPNFGVNGYQLREGDYILLEYKVATW